jgi:hypothetical protein
MDEEHNVGDQEDDQSNAGLDVFVGGFSDVIEDALVAEGKIRPTETFNTRHTTGRQTKRLSSSQPSQDEEPPPSSSHPSQDEELMPPPQKRAASVPPTSERAASVPPTSDSGLHEFNALSNLGQKSTAVVQASTNPGMAAADSTPTITITQKSTAVAQASTNPGMAAADSTPTITITRRNLNHRRGDFVPPRRLEGSFHVQPQGSERNESRQRTFSPSLHVCFLTNTHDGDVGQFIIYRKGQYKEMDPNMNLEKPLHDDDRKRVIYSYDGREYRLFAR